MAEAVKEATRDFVRKAYEYGALDEKDVEGWLTEST